MPKLSGDFLVNRSWKWGIEKDRKMLKLRTKSGIKFLTNVTLVSQVKNIFQQNSNMIYFIWYFLIWYDMIFLKKKKLMIWNNS